MARPRKPIQKIEIRNEVLINLDARAEEKGISREDLFCQLLTKDEKISDFTMITLTDFVSKLGVTCEYLVKLLSRKRVLDGLFCYILIEADVNIEELFPSYITN